MRRDLELGPVPLRLDFRGRGNPFDQRPPLRQILPFPAYPGSGTMPERLEERKL